MESTSLKFLSDSGLLFEINRRVLHPFGYALALQWNDEDTSGEPGGVLLYKTDHTTGVVFSPETFRNGESKFAKFLEEVGNSKLTERSARLGFETQTTEVAEEE